MIIDTLFKLQENTPFRYNIIENFSAFVSSNMGHKSENCSIRFRKLADKLYSLNKVPAEISDNSKNQIDNILKILN